MHSQNIAVLQEYVKRDFHIITLKHNSKEPVTKWKDNWIKDINTINIQQHNIGLICDKIIVFDADTEQAIEFLEQMNEFKETATVKTIRGKHFYFLKSKPYVVKTERLHQNEIIIDENAKEIFMHDIKIDVKADNSYVVAPPSSIDSHTYTFEKDLSQIKTLSFDEYKKLLQKIKDKLNINKKNETSEKTKTTKSENIDFEKLKKIILTRYEAGHRQNTIMFLSGWLRKEGIPRETVEQIVTDICLKAQDRDIKQRLSAVEQAWKKSPTDLKGLSGLGEMGYDISEISQLIQKPTYKESYGFFTDGVFVYVLHKKKEDYDYILIGPYLKINAKIVNENDIEFEVEFERRRKFLKEIKDIETIRKMTGIEIFHEKSFLRWLVSATRDPIIPLRYIRTQTGWKERAFYHPSLQTDDIWDKWYWSKKIKQYRNKPELQHQLIKEALRDGRYLAIVYAFCLASVLNEILNVNPAVLFISGAAHVGKTTVAQLGINLFLPAEDVFITSHATAVGFELLMKSLKDLPILFDECILKDLDLEKIVFMVASRVGKVRGTKSLSINISDIASNVIFTSEVLEQNMFKRAGAQRRFLGITIEEFQKSCFSKTTIEEIQKWKKYYGAGIDIIQFIQSNFDKIKEIKSYVEQDIDKYKLHSIYHIALSLLTAVRVFEAFYNEKFDYAYEYALLTLDSQRKEFEQKIDIVGRFLDEFSQFLVRKNSQIVEPESDKRLYGEIIGQREGNSIYILTKIFQDFCQECGFEKKILIKELIKHNILRPYKYNEPRTPKKISGTLVSTYCIMLKTNE